MAESKNKRGTVSNSIKPTKAVSSSKKIVTAKATTNKKSTSSNTKNIANKKVEINKNSATKIKQENLSSNNEDIKITTINIDGTINKSKSTKDVTKSNSTLGDKKKVKNTSKISNVAKKDVVSKVVRPVSTTKNIKTTENANLTTNKVSKPITTNPKLNNTTASVSYLNSNIKQDKDNIVSSKESTTTPNTTTKVLFSSDNNTSSVSNSALTTSLDDEIQVNDSKSNIKVAKEKKVKKEKVKKEKVKKSKNNLLEEEPVIKNEKKINCYKRALNILLVAYIIVFIVSSIMYAFANTTAKNDNIPSFLNSKAVRNNQQITSSLKIFNIPDKNKLDSADYIQFKGNKAVNKGDIVAFKNYFQSSKDRQWYSAPLVGKVEEFNPTNANIIKIKFAEPLFGRSTIEINKNDIIGNYSKVLTISTSTMGILLQGSIYAYVCVIPLLIICILVVIILILLANKRSAMRKYERDEPYIKEEIQTEEVKEEKIVEDNENSIDNIVVHNKKSNSISDLAHVKVAPLKNDNGDLNIQNENYYTDVVASNNLIYQRIEKFKESIIRLKETGANDMDIIRINMIGNDEFDKLLNINRNSAQHLELEDIISFLNTLKEVHCIKKTGKINWTYKYKSKTFAIIREEKNGFKISFKLYPDAADKLNSIFMAFEDSNFPAGPYWYMVNNLRNIPVKIVKWALEESYNISTYQEIKSTLLREDKSLNELIDSNKLKNACDAKKDVTIFDKFAVVIRNKNLDSPKDCILDKKIPKLSMDSYNREFYFPLDDTQALSILFDKKAPESLTNAFSYDLFEVIHSNNELNINSVNDITTINNSQSTSLNSGVVIKKNIRKR